MNSAPFLTKGFRSVRVWLGVGISVGFLVLVLRQVEWASTGSTLRTVDGPLIVLGGGLYVVAFGLFAVRWKLLLSGIARLRVADTFSHIMIGYMANTVLPLRLGDVARATMMGRKHGIGVVAVLSSVVLERFLDILTVLALIFGLSFVLDVPPIVRTSMAGVAGAVFAGLSVLFLLAINERRLPGLATRVPGFVPAALAHRLAAFLTNLVGGLRTLRQGRQLAVVAFLSALGWAAAGVGTILWVEAFHVPAPWYAGFFVVALVNLGGAIPSSPGSIGVYHYFAVLALSVWVSDKSIALGYAIGSHAVYILIIVVLGLAGLSREGFSLLKPDSLMSAVRGHGAPSSLSEEVTNGR